MKEIEYQTVGYVTVKNDEMFRYGAVCKKTDKGWCTTDRKGAWRCVEDSPNYSADFIEELSKEKALEYQKKMYIINLVYKSLENLFLPNIVHGDIYHYANRCNVCGGKLSVDVNNEHPETTRKCITNACNHAYCDHAPMLQLSLSVLEDKHARTLGVLPPNTTYYKTMSKLNVTERRLKLILDKITSIVITANWNSPKFITEDAVDKISEFAEVLDGLLQPNHSYDASVVYPMSDAILSMQHTSGSTLDDTLLVKVPRLLKEFEDQLNAPKPSYQYAKMLLHLEFEEYGVTYHFRQLYKNNNKGKEDEKL